MSGYCLKCWKRRIFHLAENGMVDGATLRRRRLIDLLTEMRHKEGMTLTEVQGFMLEKYGLKFETTGRYLKEMAMAGVVKDTGRKWKAVRIPLEE